MINLAIIIKNRNLANLIMIPHTLHKYILIVGLILLLSIPSGAISMGRNLQQLTEEQIRNLIDAKIQEKINAIN